MSFVKNCIFWEGRLNGSNFIRYSDIQGGYEGLGNINADPLFVDADNGDFSLQPNSPCINSGDPESPLDSDGTRADIGASFHGITFIRGDANRDKSLDISDPLDTLIYLFCNRQNPNCLNNEYCCKCLDSRDANDDGIIDISDPIYSLQYLFRDSLPPPAPFPELGRDTTRDELSCLEY